MLASRAGKLTAEARNVRGPLGPEIIAHLYQENRYLPGGQQ